VHERIDAIATIWMGYVMGGDPGADSAELEQQISCSDPFEKPLQDRG
jgi:hypothetical protein